MRLPDGSLPFAVITANTNVVLFRVSRSESQKLQLRYLYVLTSDIYTAINYIQWNLLGDHNIWNESINFSLGLPIPQTTKDFLQYWRPKT